MVVASVTVHLIRLDPYDPNLGVLVPIVGKRIMDFAREHNQELDPVLVTQAVMVPLWSRDPFMAVFAMVNTESGAVVGHVGASINSDGMNHWLTISQTQADGAVGDAVKRSIESARAWVDGSINQLLTARGFGPVARISVITGKNEKAWERELGLKLERRFLGSPLHRGEEVLEEGSGPTK